MMELADIPDLKSGEFNHSYGFESHCLYHLLHIRYDTAKLLKINFNKN